MSIALHQIFLIKMRFYPHCAVSIQINKSRKTRRTNHGFNTITVKKNTSLEVGKTWMNWIKYHCASCVGVEIIYCTMSRKLGDSNPFFIDENARKTTFWTVTETKWRIKTNSKVPLQIAIESIQKVSLAFWLELNLIQ